MTNPNCCQENFNGKFRLPFVDPALCESAPFTVWAGDDLNGQQFGNGLPIQNGSLPCGRICTWRCTNLTSCGTNTLQRTIHLVMYQLIDGHYYLRVVLGRNLSSGSVWAHDFGVNPPACRDIDQLSLPLVFANDANCSASSNARVTAAPNDGDFPTNAFGGNPACCTNTCFDGSAPWRVQMEISGAKSCGAGALCADCPAFNGTWILAMNRDAVPGNAVFEHGPCRWSVPINICRFVEMGLFPTSAGWNLFLRHAVAAQSLQIALTQIGPTFVNPGKDRDCDQWNNLDNWLSGGFFSCAWNPICDGSLADPVHGGTKGIRVRLNPVAALCP